MTTFVAFSDLVLLNDDRVEGGGGFATHEHIDMEVFSYVLEGALTHRDSIGGGSTVRAGEVLVMSAGIGITHCEYNEHADEDVRFLQAWVTPRTRGVAPRYGQRAFPDEVKRGRFCPILSPDGRDQSLIWHADAVVSAALLDGREQANVNLAPNRYAYVHVIRGMVVLNGTRLDDGAGARIRSERRLSFTRASDAEVLVFDLPPSR